MCRTSYIHNFCILNLAFDDDTHKPGMKMRELTLREKLAIWMLKENSKSIRAIAKNKGHGEIKSLETTSDTSNQQLPDRL